ncbi:MAG: hypothetical protein EOO15_10855 [Chitinophagaceae bacterium]|nr:MAG: hypothetical protein EOO15_10855 [Chitinophagaceae bacterium]
MKRTIIAATALAALSLTACKKKDTETTPGNTQPTVAYLKKLTETQNGTSKVFTFTYDNQHRLLNFKTANNSEGTVFTYDATGNLTSVDEKEEDFHNLYTYTYASGKPVSATFKSWVRSNGQDGALFEDDALTYTVTGNRVTGMHLEMLQDNDEMDFTLTYDANGEVTEIKDGNNIYKANFTWGTHKSAMPAVTSWVLDQAGFSTHFYARRELITKSYDLPGTVNDRSETTTYTFNAAGYPLTATRNGVVTTFEYQ